jgi:hypothetical protein
VNYVGEVDATAGTTLWYIQGTDLDAVAIYSAALTASNADELAIIEGALSGDDTITLSPFNDQMSGFGGNDQISGGAGNDFLSGGAGDDTIMGGADVDTAVYTGLRADYQVTVDDQGYHVMDQRTEGSEGTDLVTDVEQFQFADGLVLATNLITNVAPIFTSGTTATIAENALVTTVVYQAAATDTDAGQTLTYSLGGSDAAAFDIDSSTGAVTLKNSADFEAQSSYAISIIATDTGDPVETATQDVAISVVDINEAPTVTSAASATIAENAPIATEVYKVIASDPDANATLTYSLSGDDAALFNIDPSTGSVTLASPADFETKSSYSINVIANDGGDPALSSTQAVTINVTDVNDAPVVAQEILDQSSSEDAAWSFTVPADVFSDVDNATLTFTASLGNDEALPSWLSFDADTRTFSGTPPANFSGGIDLKVTASDGALSGSDTFTLTVTPVNDIPAAADDTVVIGGTSATYSSAALLANDSDVDGDALTITAVGTASHGTVTLNGSDIVFTPGLDFVSSGGFDYTVSDGHGGTDTAHVTVNLGLTGTVADGYLAGATVYADVNGNSELDTGEPSTTSDANGDFVLADGQGGALRAFGGTNIDTGRLNELHLSAPIGSTVVNPLTTLIETLVEGGDSIANAEAKVEQAFNLDAGLDLTQLDLIEAAPNNPQAFAAQQAAVAVADVLGAVATANGDTDAALDQLASLIDAGGAVDLTASAVLDNVIAAGLPNASAEERAGLVAEAQQTTTAIYAAEDLAGIIQAQLDVSEQPGWRMFTRDGFVGEIGGTGEVFGTGDFQDITVIDTAGTVTFDPSFNRGGDIVRLSGDADAWFIERSGSNAVLTDGDTIVRVAVGTTGMALVFDDGARTLHYDSTAASMKIGDQSFAEGFTTVTAAADGVSLPTGGDADALARLLLPEGGEVVAGGHLDVFGTNGAEKVMLTHGDITLDPSFNRGNDDVTLDDPVATFTAALSGSNVVLEGADTHLVIPVGTGLALAFADGEAALTYNAQLNEVLIGTQVIGHTAAPLTDFA